MYLEKVMKVLLLSLSLASLFIIIESIAIHFIGIHPGSFFYLDKDLINEGSQYIRSISSPFGYRLYRPFGVLLMPQISGFVSANAALIAMGFICRDMKDKNIYMRLFLLNFVATLLCLGKLAILAVVICLICYYLTIIKTSVRAFIIPVIILLIIGITFNDLLVSSIISSTALITQYLKPINTDLKLYFENINLIIFFIGNGYVPTYYSYTTIGNLGNMDPIQETQFLRLLLQIGAPMTILWFFIALKGFVGNYIKYIKTNDPLYLSSQYIILLLVISLLHYNVVFHIVNDMIFVYAIATGMSLKT